jgi:hypothetical protein
MKFRAQLLEECRHSMDNCRVAAPVQSVRVEAERIVRVEHRGCLCVQYLVRTEQRYGGFALSLDPKWRYVNVPGHLYAGNDILSIELSRNIQFMFSSYS